jgi:hypothetical protein
MGDFQDMLRHLGHDDLDTVLADYQTQVYLKYWEEPLRLKGAEGKSLKDLIAANRNYVSWLSRGSFHDYPGLNLAADLALTKNIPDPAVENGPYIFPFGKHKGRSFDFVKEHDEEYIRWLYRTKYETMDDGLRHAVDNMNLKVVEPASIATRRKRKHHRENGEAGSSKSSKTKIRSKKYKNLPTLRAPAVSSDDEDTEVSSE